MSRSGTERVVIVTGASSGIGRATAHLLSERGFHVVLAARSTEALRRTQQECPKGSTTVVATDCADNAQVERLFRSAARRTGRIDAVVHCAAVLAYGRFEDVPVDVFDATLAVVVHGTANVARAALRHFARSGGGRLVVVGSLLGKIATPYMSSYVTSKWAVHGLVRCLQIEARQTPGIDISLVSPGGVNTPVYLQAGTYGGRHGRPPPPISSPERVAKTIARRIERPARETGVGPLNGLTVTGFRFAPMVFDRIVTPLMELGGLSRAKVDPSPGNVFSPVTAGEAVHGDWGPRPVARILTAAALATGALGIRAARTAAATSHPLSGWRRKVTPWAGR